jgi:glycosyltransferase involved in cell wall biosynthesis
MSVRNAEVVIINCSTRELTALALLSALRHANLPVTVIDCESTDGSIEFFRRMQQQFTFRLEQRPLARHGVTLDRIVRDTTADTLLLLDSDAEILDPQLVPAMLAALQPGVYGSGFLHAGEWLAAHDRGEQRGRYAPRMWIPCVMLDVAAARSALAAGISFRQRVICNEVPQVPWLSKLLYLRLRLPVLRRVALDSLRRWRRVYDGQRPQYVYCDTGADVHAYLVQRGLTYADLGAAWWPTAVAHYHGVTRHALRRSMRNAADVDTSRAAALARIAKAYGVQLPDGEAATSGAAHGE